MNIVNKKLKYIIHKCVATVHGDVVDTTKQKTNAPFLEELIKKGEFITLTGLELVLDTKK